MPTHRTLLTRMSYMIIAGLWIEFKYLWECCPRGLHSGSPHCVFVASWLTDYCMAFLWFCCFALVFFCHTNPWGDTMLSSLLVRFRCLWTDQLITGRAGFSCVLWVFLSVLFGFCCLPFCFARWQLNGLWSIQFSSLLYAHCRYDWCCHCINSVNLQNAIVFPAW